MKTPFRQILLYTNPTRDAGFAITERIGTFLEESGIDVRRASALEKPIPNEIDLVITVGGDGTILGVVPFCGEKPILGVNAGSVGFLTAFDAAECEERLREVLSGSAVITGHRMLTVEVEREGTVLRSFEALNDAVVTGDRVARTVVLDVLTNGRHMARVRGDGMIAATPTGSTAYSMSAGGPVLDPELEAFILTPVCAHNVIASSFVVPNQSVACIESVSEDTFLTVDGRTGCALWKGDRVLIRRSEKSCRLVRLQNYNFYDIIDQKLFDGR